MTKTLPIRYYDYSNIELLAMVKVYVMGNYSSRGARRLYSDPDHLNSLQRRGIPNPRTPSANKFTSVWQHLLDSGQFRTPKYIRNDARIRNKSKYNDKLAARVAEYFETHPGSSMRKAAQHFDVSAYYISKLMNRESEEEPYPPDSNDQDGATCHTARATMYQLRGLFSQKLISRFGDIAWLSRSPDLIPMEFFRWEYLKSKVYVNTPRNIAKLKQNIQQEIRDIEP
ncbi:unnamed protein product [Spodoptera littoralis]|uniref:HTH psq-type domain-containing protein n=1 Tax=Spodoptera littoralis TaxID=7109 RepID=A0A9P0I5X1_SPOLI|nr:unnamed protein product [Spodoptera littoralis]CAH1642036.1 unnamed protein product [Spodoptera littoralis]